jgi:hypothetical protein
LAVIPSAPRLTAHAPKGDSGCALAVLGTDISIKAILAITTAWLGAFRLGVSGHTSLLLVLEARF